MKNKLIICILWVLFLSLSSYAFDNNTDEAEFLGRISYAKSFFDYTEELEEEFEDTLSPHNKLSKYEFKQVWKVLDKYDYSDGEVYEIIITNENYDIILICAEIQNYKKSLSYKAWNINGIKFLQNYFFDLFD